MRAPARILVIDDEENIRHALRRALRREGYEVFDAASPQAALALLKEKQVDVVICDNLMPEMTGLELLKLIVDRHPDCVRIMLTGHADMETAIEAINFGEIHRFLVKPWDDAELKVTLFSALETLFNEREHRRASAVVRCKPYRPAATSTPAPKPPIELLDS